LENQDQEDFGTLDDITPCECTKRGGNWSEFPCEDAEKLPGGRQLLCYAAGDGPPVPGSPQDVRWPHACCVYDLETGIISCKNVCGPDECASYNTETSTSIYYDDGSVCEFVGPEGQPPRFCGDGLLGEPGDSIPRSGERSGEVTEEFRAGSCIFRDTVNGKLNCGNYTKDRCGVLDGFFVGFDDEGNNIPCGTYPATTTRESVGPTTISSSELSKYSVGDDFHNIGIYCGVYNPEESLIQYTDSFSGPTSTMNSVADGVGGKKGERWAIILHNYDLGQANFGLNGNTRETSTWSGDHNLRLIANDTITAIKNYKINGVDGWRIPSIKEQAFIQKNLLEDPDTYFKISTRNLTQSYPEKYNFMVPNKKSYLSSTIVKLGGSFFVQSYNFVSHENIGGFYEVMQKGEGRIKKFGSFSSILLNDLNFQDLEVRPIKILKVVD
tara:strand:- start:276 stop:1595 length:1320 start_codon:yes stop_codon:yes gene_type:complete